MKILSLFDGMACGMLAMQKADIPVDRYVAYEIDKYAVQTSSHNFHMIEHRGDVFAADFTEFSGFDFLVGGSPCTYWSIAQKNNRETEASGMGWELFSQYVRALREAQPMYFIYENNKSMAKAIRESIDEAFGFEAICINSALVSAQNRQRLYWVGKRNPDGTYSKVHAEQPEDRGILLKDILESGYCWKDKQGTIDANYSSPKKQSGQRMCVSEPVNVTTDGKAQCLRSTYYKDGIRNMVGNTIDRKTCVAEPVGTTKDENGNGYAKYECREDGKANTLDTNTVNGAMVAEPIRVGTWPNEAKNQEKHDSQQYRIYSTDGKGVTLCGNGGGLGAKTGLYAVDCKPPYAEPCEWDEDGKPIKAVSVADGKVYAVYEVKDGQITIKGKTYPIKLVDGFYIIRKLTVSECMRLQTVPEWYEFPVSDSQAYKMLGNGWTVDVIVHLLKATQEKSYERF